MIRARPGGVQFLGSLATSAPNGGRETEKISCHQLKNPVFNLKIKCNLILSIYLAKNEDLDPNEMLS